MEDPPLELKNVLTGRRESGKIMARLPTSDSCCHNMIICADTI